MFDLHADEHHKNILFIAFLYILESKQKSALFYKNAYCENVYIG